MRCFLRYLRIALSVVCGLVCVLLVALWVRSFVVCDSLSINSGHRIASLGGALFFDGNFVISGGKLTATQRRLFGYEIQCVSLDWKKVRQGAGSGPCVPYWIVVLAASTLSTPFWVRWRFSLRTLLIATTLVAAVMGLIVYAIRY